MASGQVVGMVAQATYPQSNPATQGVRVGGSSPAESWPVHNFDTATNEYLDFLCYLDGYGGGGLTIEHEFMMASATTGNIEIETSIRRVQRGAEDLDTSHTYSAQTTGAVSVPATSGYTKQATTTHTDGAQMDSLADGEWFLLRVMRDTTVASDAAGDMQYIGIPVIKET